MPRSANVVIEVLLTCATKGDPAAPRHQWHVEETEPLGWRFGQTRPTHRSSPDPSAEAGFQRLQAIRQNPASRHNRKRPAGEAGRFWGYYREERTASRQAASEFALAACRIESGYLRLIPVVLVAHWRITGAWMHCRVGSNSPIATEQDSTGP
jgi:hypothetical protein